MDALAAEHFSGSAEAEGATFVLSEPGQDTFPSEGYVICGLAQAHFRASLFREVRVVTVDVEHRRLVDQVRFSLPSKEQIPAKCEQPPEGLYLR
jgi:hypothetical protein